MKSYFNEKERENLYSMLNSLDIENVNLAIAYIKSHSKYYIFAVRYLEKSRYSSDTIDSVIRICEKILDDGFIPYAAQILSKELL